VARIERSRVPPLSPDLLAAISRAGPVATRRPKLILAGVLIMSLGWAGLLLGSVIGVRSDLRGLPAWPLALYVAISLTGFAAHLTFALVPPPGKILPAAYESARASVTLMLITVPLGLLFGTNVAVARAPVSSALRFWPGSLVCVAEGLVLAALPVVLGLGALRRVVPGGAWRTALAVGAGSGVLAGVVLQLHCPNAGGAHVTLAHGLAMILPALLLVAVQDRAL
jgi:hypothetical protein